MNHTEKYILYVINEDHKEKFFGPFNSPEEALEWGKNEYLYEHSKCEIAIKTLYYPMKQD